MNRDVCQRCGRDLWDGECLVCDREVALNGRQPQANPGPGSLITLSPPGLSRSQGQASRSAVADGSACRPLSAISPLFLEIAKAHRRWAELYQPHLLESWLA